METEDKIYVTVEELKKHLNIDFDDDNAYLVELAKVAQDMIATFLNRKLADMTDKDGCLPPAVRHALKLQVGNLYANRESVTYGAAGNIPFTLQAILRPLKNYSQSEAAES